MYLAAENHLAACAGSSVGGPDFFCRLDLPPDVSGKLASHQRRGCGLWTRIYC